MTISEFSTKKEYHYPCTSNTNCNSIDVSLEKGWYLIEAWGAEGGGIPSGSCSSGSEEIIGGRGGYASGVLRLEKTTTLFLFIGKSGHTYTNPYEAFNGGGFGYSSGGGGGATDVRVINGSAESEESYSSRILVAGGGGGTDCNGFGGSGGGINGKDATFGGTGGTQTSGGHGLVDGEKWKGASTSQNACGGGGGYFGGGSGTISERGNGGGGGSGYISGHPDCSTYQNYIFKKTILLSGDDEIPSPNGYEFNAYRGDGVIRITLLPSCFCTQNTLKLSLTLLVYICFIMK